MWGWVEPSPGTFDFSAADTTVTEAQDAGLGMLATLWPYAEWDQRACRTSAACEVDGGDIFYSTQPGQGLPSWRCPPCSVAAWQEAVRRLVERYDGDGVDDMPGLRIPIKFWEVLNEPENDSVTFFRGADPDYVLVLEATYGAVKAACPECQILHGAMMGLSPTAQAFWSEVFLHGWSFFDLGNIHFFHSSTNADIASLNITGYRGLIESLGLQPKPAWVTEAQYASAGQVVASVDGALAAGAVKVFFTEYRIGSIHADGGILPGYDPVYDGIAAHCP
ncbi:MAG: hypothetical protein HY906_17695 [Deltaproteobacteria bacterium]|nr:hypothetical protein [Deltaproteobacteria bacterium]